MDALVLQNPFRHSAFYCMKSTVFWNCNVLNPVEVQRHFGGMHFIFKANSACCLLNLSLVDKYSILKMEAIHPFEISAKLRRTKPPTPTLTPPPSPNTSLHSDLCGKLKSILFCMFILHISTVIRELYIRKATQIEHEILIWNFCYNDEVK